MKIGMVGWLMLVLAGPAVAWQNPPPAPPPHQAASQIHSSADAQLQASVRKAIANDASLSDAGHQVAVIVSDGAVVLRGPVKDDTEKTRIDTLVRQVGGVKEVTNELDVRPPT
ncbi:BON domain-containing protein [Dyella kyungheensis]|uniref:BON domain-containing protein n=1 Tax=Dyella kyungheensis TaxID=1242174 RepID=A0ABS2JR10_9GAMM|nr:BON domain-containing protein [Dyella kyungheensis]MBM7121464.1 BON domain-containing protein [Dyella kyungheensis]